MRIGVVGLGAAGLSAALAAADAGHEVIGYEQAALGNDEASSGGRGKIIRFGYSNPFYASLMRETMTRWEALAERTGRTLMVRHGGLHLGPPAVIGVVASGITDAGQAYQDVTGTDPRFGARPQAGERAVYEPTAGVMWPGEVRAALAEAATGAGAVLHEYARVTAVRPVGDGIEVRTGAGTQAFDRVVIAGGPWAFRLAPRAAPSFAITRRFQAVFRTADPIGDGRTRPWIDHSDRTYYGMINVAAGLHLIGLHPLDADQPVTDPDEPVDTAVRDASIAGQLEYVADRFGVHPDLIEVRVCHYTSRASEDFVIDECPGLPGAVLLSACSGHGFKFTITSGAVAAALATGTGIPDRERFALRMWRQ